MKTDIVLFSVPPVLLQGPHLAPAMLKSYLAEKGYNAKCLNPSMDLFDSLPLKNQDNWPYNDFEVFYANKQKELELTLQSWKELILEYNPHILGLSTHAWSSLFFLEKFSSYFKKKCPDIPVVIGGPPAMDIGPDLKTKGFIDHFVGGDGEEALISILEGKFDHHNIDCTRPIGISNEDFNNLPEPDYSDSNFELIKERFPNNNKIYLISSRGCVFNCSFCNVPFMTEKYRFKDGDKFANEVFNIQKKYGPKTIELADSLINGSMKIYRDFLNNILEIKKKENISFNFDAFFRVRSDKTMTPEDFKMSADAGMKRIRIGVESGSREVRLHIGKQETNEDIFYTIKMCKEYNIAVNILILAGYVNETQKRFEETLDFLKEVRKRELDLIVDTVVVNELYISKGTRLKEMVPSLGVKGITDDNSENNERQWTVTDENGETIDSPIRNQRVAQIKEYVKYNFRAIGKVVISSNEDESCEFKNEWEDQDRLSKV